VELLCAHTRYTEPLSHSGVEGRPLHSLSMDAALQVINRLEGSARRQQQHNQKGAKFTSPTKIKAKLLQDKEELNSKRSRLECLLNQQLVAKYGSKQPNSQLNLMIKGMIHENISRSNNFESPRFLSTLESMIQESSAEYKQKIQTSRQENFQRSQSANNQMLSSGGPNGTDDAHRSAKNLNPNQWSVLNAIQSVTAEEEARKARQLLELKKLRFRDELDQQLLLVEQQKEKEKLAKTKLRNETEKALMDIEREKDLVKRTQYLKHQQDRDMIKYQIEERKLYKEMEREESIRQDQIEMRRAQERALEEEEMKLRKKLKEKEQQEQLRLENERVKEKKRIDQLRQYEEEKRLEQEYR
jgi:hypothetical protein